MAGAVGVVLVLVVAGVLLYVILGRTERGGGGGGEEAKIRQLTEDFAAAIARNDQAKTLSLLCAEEADAIREDDDYDPSPDAVATGRPADANVRISDVRIAGEVASARLTHPSRQVTTLYYQRESGTWKVCAAAADRMPAGPSPGPSG